MKNKYILLVFCLLALFADIFGQENHGGKPITFRQASSEDVVSKVKHLNMIKAKILEKIDNTSEIEKAEKFAQTKGFQRNKFYGRGLEVDIDFKKEATIQMMGDSGKLYLFQISSPTANALQVYFDAFKLPKGARMFIYDQNQTMFLGSFTHENNFIDKSFGTTFINGNTVVIEYYEPNNTEFVSEIHINKVVHVFQDVNSGPFASTASASCNLNSTCSIGYGWERERKSVAVVLAEYKDYFKPSHSNMDYYGFGTGTLLNNVKQDGAAYFLTANHLRELDEIGNPILQLNKYPINDIYHWLFLFNYQSTSCDDKGSGFSSSTLKSLYASRVLSSDEYHSPLSDYLLLELNADAATLKDYNVCYAGWDIDDVHAIFSKFTVCIHHPQGDIMKMSKDHDPPVSGTCLNATNDTHWVVSWDEGITEQGSSGSPLFNDNHKLIGHLHAGSSDCAHPQYPDFFGKFSDSYFYGNFATWLDPDNTRSTSVGPYNPNTIGSCEHCYNGIPDGDETGIDCGGKDCPPCTWMNTYGWASNPLSHNGIKDEAQGEIGIDCGGPNCKPCGGDALCSDGIKDGDETDVDCGGSCIPCNVYCQGQVIYWGLGLNPVTVITTPLTAPGFDSHPAHIASDTGIPDPNNASLLPAYTSTSNFIEASNSHVNSGEVVTFKSAGKIKLKTGFSAKIGSTFKAKYTTCEKCKKMYVSVPDRISTGLQISQSGADRYDIKVINGSFQNVYSFADYIYDKNPTLWNTNDSNIKSGAYRVIINFYNDCSGEKKTFDYIINVLNGFFAKPLIGNTDNLLNSENNVSVYPNPTKDMLVINDQNNEKYSVQIYDFSGKLVESIQNCFGSTNVNMSKYVNGIYTFKILGTTLYVQKVIKN